MIIRAIYKALKKAGCELDSHESDLYCKKDTTSEHIISMYDYKCNVTTFKSEIDGTTWYDIPFSYTPFWDKKPTKED